MPLFTTKPTDQFFERFMKHQQISSRTLQRPTAFRPNWTQKKKGKEEVP